MFRHAIKIFLLTFLLGTPTVLLAIVGCLPDEEQLVPRASIIMIGKIEKLEVAGLGPCPPAADFETELNRRYEKCGEVTGLTVVVNQRIKGHVPDRATVLVASEGFLVLSCDDRPPVEKMVGREALFFLESSEDRLWTLDGPNSIYVGATADRVAAIMRTEGVHLTIDLDRCVALPGQAIEVTHRLSSTSESNLPGGIGTDNYWRFENTSRNALSRELMRFSPLCLQSFILEPGHVVEWKQTVLVPSDAALGETKVRARIQILADPHCPGWSCGYTFLESQPVMFRVIEPRTDPPAGSRDIP